MAWQIGLMVVRLRSLALNEKEREEKEEKKEKEQDPHTHAHTQPPYSCSRAQSFQVLWAWWVY